MKITEKSKGKGKDKRVYIHGVSAVGVAVYPHLNEPDTKFDADGVYVTELLVEGDDAKDMIKTLKAIYEKCYKREVAKFDEDDEKPTKSDFPWKQAVNDDGKPVPGKYLFKFKKGAAGTYKSGKKAGERWESSVRIFDAAGAVIPDDMPVWGGTKMRVAFEVRPWLVKGEFGIKLSPDAVRVLDLVTKGGGSAASFGFDDEEDGFRVPTTTAAAGGVSDEADEPDEDEDF